MLLESIDNSMKSGKYVKNEEFNKETEIIKKKKKDQTNFGGDEFNE